MVCITTAATIGINRLSSILKPFISKSIPSISIETADPASDNNQGTKNKAPRNPAMAPAMTPSKNFSLWKGCFKNPYGPTSLETESPKARIIMEAMAISFGKIKTTTKAPMT